MIFWESSPSPDSLLWSCPLTHCWERGCCFSAGPSIAGGTAWPTTPSRRGSHDPAEHLHAHISYQDLHWKKLPWKIPVPLLQMYATSSSWCTSVDAFPLLLSLYIPASITLPVEPNWWHHQGGLSAQAGCHCPLFAFKHSCLPLLFLPLCTSHPNLWPNIRKLLRNPDDERSIEVLAIDPYYFVTWFSLNVRGL